MHLLAANARFALRDLKGITTLGAGAPAGSASGLVAGDWNNDGKADAATVSAFADGTTHVGVLTNSGAAALSYQPDAWVTPPGEVQKIIGCVRCWPLNGMPLTAADQRARRPLAVKIDNAPPRVRTTHRQQADMVMSCSSRASSPGSPSIPLAGSDTSVRSERAFSTATDPDGARLAHLLRRLAAHGRPGATGIGPAVRRCRRSSGQGSTFYRTNVTARSPRKPLHLVAGAGDATTRSRRWPVDVPRWTSSRRRSTK